jgi:hypothetical protein
MATGKNCFYIKLCKATFQTQRKMSTEQQNIGPCHVSGIFLPLRVNSLPLATIYEVKIPLRKWKKSLLQRNPAQMTWAIVHTTFATIFAAILQIVI